MRRLVRALAVTAALVLTVVGLTLNPPTARAADAAVEAYGSCLVGEKKGDLLMLFDESGSLKSSDPEQARVTAARYLVRQLVRSAASSAFDLDVSLAGFSTDYHQVLGWTALTADNQAKVLAGVDEFAGRNNGRQTDYWNGLNGARTRLAAKAKGDPDRCQAVVWFSDGAFDISLVKPDDYANAEDGRRKLYAPDADLRRQDEVDQAKAAALKDLCRPKGLADQVRQQGVTLFAVGLSGDSKPNFDTMRNVATGQDSCGRRTKPVPGSFTPVENIDDLIAAFDKITNPGTTTTTRICQKAPAQCREQGHVFVLDNSLNRVHILGDAKKPGREVYLLPPVGQGPPIQLKRARGETEIAQIKDSASTYEWVTDRTVVVDLDNAALKARPWTGAWSLVFVDPAESAAGDKVDSTISISADIFPVWPNRTELRSGEATDLTFGLANSRGQTIDASRLLGTVGFTATLLTPDGQELDIATLGKTTLSQPQRVDLTGVPPGQGTLRLTLDVTTAAAGSVPGTKLEPRSADLSVDIAPPRGLPTLGSEVDFGSITGPAEAAGALSVAGPGCVWLPTNADLEVEVGPEGVDPVAITAAESSAERCLKVREGEQATLQLQLTTAEAGNGTLAGTVPVTVAPIDAPDRTTVLDVPFTADLHRPLKPAIFLAGFLAALILGPGIPLLLLAALKRWTAKIPGQTLVAQEIPVTVTEGQVLRDGAPLALRGTDFNSIVRLQANGSRTAEVPGARLQTKTGWSPFGAGFVETVMPGRVALSSTHSEPYGSERVARLPLAVHNTWFVSRDPGAPAGQATVVVLAGLDPTGERRQKLVDDIATRLPGLMPALGGAPATVTPESGTDPYGTDRWGTGPDNPPAGPTSPTGPARPAPTPPPPPARPATPAAPEQPFSFDFSADEDDPGRHT